MTYVVYDSVSDMIVCCDSESQCVCDSVCDSVVCYDSVCAMIVCVIVS